MPRIRTKADIELLANAIQGVKTEGDVDEIFGLAEKIYGPLSSRAVGDRPNNIGTIRVGSDPPLGLVERVTNGMDALLDLGEAMHPSDEPTCPIEAANIWYGVPRTGLADMSDTDRRAVGEKLKVWLEESGEPRRPTVVVEDQGIGQSPRDFPSTLLSLNETNKMRQPWNMGTYGQGGAVTYGFSKATIIISRRHPQLVGDGADRIGWTVVREIFTDPTANILPSYEYMVDSRRQVLELDPAYFPGFEHGTRIVSVSYDLQGWTGPFTTGIWQFLHAALFEPVLPFLVTGKRAKEKEYGSRIVIGNVARLERPEAARGDIEIAHKDSTKLDLGSDFGEVVFNYWVVRRPLGSGSRSEAAGGYVRPDSAISMTLFGQRQDTERRIWIKNQAQVPFLYKNLIVQINANGLTALGKREIFASTRERATKSDLRERIYERLASILRNDEELKRLNHEEKERLLQRSTTTSSEKVRKRLAQFIKTKLRDLTKAGRGGTETGEEGRRKKKPGKPAPPRDISDDHLHHVPTRLEFERKSIRINQGAGAYTWVHIDAKNGYLPSQDENLNLLWEGEDPKGKVRLTMRSKLLGGKSRWYFECEGDAPPGDYRLRASLVTPNGVLSDTTTITVAVPPTAKPTGKGTEAETGPRVEWVTEDQWNDHNGMDAKSVGYVTVDDEETIIWVNRHFHPLKKALARKTLTPEAVETRATRYQFPVACALWLQDQAARTAENPPSERYQKAENERMAEAVLVAIDPDVELALAESAD